MRLFSILRYLRGPGGRMSNNQLLPGLKRGTLKHHFELHPLFAMGGLTIVFLATALGLRMSTINFRKKEGFRDYYSNHQLKWMNVLGIDYETVSQVPDYKKDDEGSKSSRKESSEEAAESENEE